jgi:hypothetical protein
MMQNRMQNRMQNQCTEISFYLTYNQHNRLKISSVSSAVEHARSLRHALDYYQFII